MITNSKKFTNIKTYTNSKICTKNKPMKIGNNNKVKNLKIHYIDIGNADSILIEQSGHNMLIDTGTNDDSTLIVNYLKHQGVKKLDYVIGTYPHKNHIGGIGTIIKTFNVNQVFIPKVTSTNELFKNVVTTLKNKGLKATYPVVGNNYNLGNAKWTILAPNKAEYKSLNNYSIVTKLKFGNNSFIFTGDAKDISERQILQKQLDIHADVLKIGNHGNASSTTDAFLKKVNPIYAVISVGKENSYGYPTYEVMERLRKQNISVFRTDEQKNIIVTSDGKNLTWNVSSWDNTKMNGYGSRSLKNGDKYIGYWKNGLFNGKGTLKYKNGDEYIGSFISGQKQGQGKYKWTNGEYYKGHWLKDKIEGTGTYIFKNGDNYEGHWSNNKMNGTGKYKFKNGKTLEGNWLNNNYIK
ncbi:MBL fold metallo-hydrolase [Haloimpatiens myeolchijeotgali]|uniref:MBL fold metallo-hydrolase n=1 Tax=Haloimpatiens sp. FM7330 TaxID=3298610 RepID=UPI00384D941F